MAETDQCPKCKGAGWTPSGPAWNIQKATCESCKGTGKLAPPAETKPERKRKRKPKPENQE